MKKYFLIFFYISLIFLVISLYKANYLEVPSILNYKLLFFSLVTLFGGFCFSTYTWYKTIHCFGYRKVSLKETLLSTGLTIFGKYIPGKVWMILGRAAYISSVYQYIPLKTISEISLNSQIMTLWVGFSLGSIALFYSPIFTGYVPLLFVAWFFFSVLLFSRFPQFFSKILYKRVLKNETNIPLFSFITMRKAVVWYIATWFCWSLSFYFAIGAIIEDPGVPVATGFCFAWAACIGIVAIVFPGGLGIREGVLFTCLSSFGLSDQHAVLISISSRLWFLTGECFIFVLALIIKFSEGKKVY